MRFWFFPRYLVKIEDGVVWLVSVIAIAAEETYAIDLVSLNWHCGVSVNVRLSAVAGDKKNTTGFRNSSVRRSGRRGLEDGSLERHNGVDSDAGTVRVLSLGFVLSPFARLGFDHKEVIAEFGYDEGGSFQ